VGSWGEGRTGHVALVFVWFFYGAAAQQGSARRASLRTKALRPAEPVTHEHQSRFWGSVTQTGMLWRTPGQYSGNASTLALRRVLMPALLLLPDQGRSVAVSGSLPDTQQPHELAITQHPFVE
jgi:hypothetical protein